MLSGPRFTSFNLMVERRNIRGSGQSLKDCSLKHIHVGRGTGFVLIDVEVIRNKSKLGNIYEVLLFH